MPTNSKFLVEFRGVVVRALDFCQKDPGSNPVAGRNLFSNLLSAESISVEKPNHISVPRIHGEFNSKKTILFLALSVELSNTSK